MPKVKVNPEILKWTRETAGLSLEEAAAKLKFKAKKENTASDRLFELETGKENPTRAMLVEMSKQYHQPLLTFYLSSPPKKGNRGQDFRTLADGLASGENALVDTLIRDIRARQSLVRTTLEEEDEAVQLPFVGSLRREDGLESAIHSIHRTLGATLEEYRSKPTASEAFKYLRSAAEKAGVFVLIAGNLGSYHTDIDTEVFRGFALADPIAPFIVINPQDSRAAWPFTLIHEFTHILLGQTGVSGISTEKKIERFCNNVAGRFLLPDEDLGQFPHLPEDDLEATKAEISRFARDRNLSYKMVAYRLFQAKQINHKLWSQVDLAFQNQWIFEETKRKEKQRKRESGPNYYVTIGYRTGKALLGLMRRMMDARAISTSKAGIVLGVKAKQVQSLLEKDASGGSRIPV